MANKEIKDFGDIGVPADADELLINDVTGDITKKVTVANLQSLSRDTGSNVGTGGVGVYKQKTGTVFEFKNINSGSSKISVTNDTTDTEVDIDIIEANIIHNNISNVGTNTHPQIDDKLTIIENNSQGWENAESAVNNNSTGWQNVTTVVNTNSAGWESVESTVDTTSTNWNTAYTHSQNNTQAHTDYLINNGNDTTSGSLSVNSLEIDGTEVISNSLNLSVNNITASGTITGEIQDVIFGDITINTANITGSNTALTVSNNISAGGTVLGSNLNISDWDNTKTTVENNSIGWENAESTVNTNSSGWESTQSTLNTNSSGWKSTESTLNTNSGTWLLNNANDTTTGSLSVVSLEIAGTEVLDSSRSLSVNNITASGTITGEIQDTTFGDITVASINATGAGVSVLVTNNISAGGTIVGSNLNITDWDNVNTVVGNNSIGWESTESTLNTNSSGWESTESTLNTNSGDWLLNNANDTTIGKLTMEALIVTQTTSSGYGGIISRNLSSDNTDNSVLGVTNSNANDDQKALGISSYARRATFELGQLRHGVGKDMIGLGNPYDFTYNKQAANSFSNYFYRNLTSNYTIGGVVGISQLNASDDQEVLRVVQVGTGNAIESVGNFSASGTVLGSNLNISDWDNVNTIVNTNSAGWELAQSTLNTNSGNWVNATTVLSNNSVGWESTESTVNINSGAWGNANLEATVQNNSTGWQNATTTLSNNSSGWESAETTLSNNSTDWVNAETILSNNSNGWESAETTLSNNSVSWVNAETTLSNNSTGWQNATTILSNNSGG